MSIRREVKESLLARLLFVLAVLLPFAVLFLLPGGRRSTAGSGSGPSSWHVFGLCFRRLSGQRNQRASRKFHG